MQINRRLFLSGTASAAALAALAACGGGSSSSNASAEPVELAASDINRQERSALQQGGEFRIPINAMIPNYNPLHIDGNVADNGTTLLGFTGVRNWLYHEDGTFEVNTNFCLDYTEAEVDGKTVITMHLNPEAKWNSGDAIQVADYQGCWQACRGTDEDFNAVVASTDGWEHIESIEAGADEFEMITTFDGVFPDWSAIFGEAALVPASLTTDAETFSSWTDASVTDHWTGPYIVTDADSAKQVLTLEPNPNWWGDAPLLDKITMRVMNTSQFGTAFGNSEIDYVSPITDSATYQQCQQRTDGEIRQAAGLQWRHFTMNGSSGVLADQAVRQALVKGMDRLTITEGDLQGLPVPASQLQLGNHLFMPHNQGYKDNTGDYAYNPEAAAAELDAAGWTLAEGAEFREKDGQRLSIKYLRMPDISTSATEGRILQANMAAIGVEIVMDDTNPDEFNARLRDGKFEITAFTWVGTPYPMNNIGQIYGEGSASNYTGVSDPELQKLIGQVAVEADPDKRVELANQADVKIWELATVTPIYSRADYAALPKKLANYGAFGLSTGRAEDVGYMAE
ncbi:ABC transporter family substrate-binding protein [Actinomyces qiguomingii]|uniref:ABC transporter family substrate-binding protein n=1 Tax=Actinomyces qiguomingii TaxID=2057800 RepID=UPI000CA00414|nr:ABC transporter family substrate-binding protein [Actinomyces qiguomingii]